MSNKARVSIEGQHSLLRKIRDLRVEVMPTALSRAVLRVTRTVMAVSAQEIAESMGTGTRVVRRRIAMRKRPSKSDPSSTIEIAGRPLNLVEFVSGAKKPRSPRVGVTAKAWNTRRKYPGVFLARMPNGRVIAVRRSSAGKAGKKIRKGRWANRSPHIEAVWGPGIAKTAAQPIMAAVRQRVVRERMEIELRHEVSYQISRKLARAARRR